MMMMIVKFMVMMSVEDDVPSEAQNERGNDMEPGNNREEISEESSGGFVWLAIYSSIVQYGVGIKLLFKFTWYHMEQQYNRVELHGDGEAIIQH